MQGWQSMQVKLIMNAEREQRIRRGADVTRLSLELMRVVLRKNILILSEDTVAE